jgi:hypothetical protein
MGMGAFQIWSDATQSLKFPMQCQILWSRIWVIVLKRAFRMVPFCRNLGMTGNPSIFLGCSAICRVISLKTVNETRL